MEAASLILPDNTVIDPTQPPPGFNFPKPDFTEIVQEHPDEKNETPLLKPTFKSALQAKKRLQAFSSARPNSLPSSPKKVKANNEEKSEETSPKKTPKKGSYHDDKAKAVIEEIEELKREEQAFFEMQRMTMRSRSRSRSQDKGRFKKVEKKSRNYRRRSPSPEKPRKSPKKVKKYPRNWREFYEFNATFDVNRDFEMAPPSGNNDLVKQLLFESPPLPIVPFKMKTVNREDKIVPFDFIRYTRAKPALAYSVNFGAISKICLTKKSVWESLPKDIAANIEKLYSNSIKFNRENEAKTKTSTLWYPKIWRDLENECKILEKSVGLSFLQSYTGEEEETEVVDEEISPKVEVKEETKKNEAVKEESKNEEVEDEDKKKKKKAKKEENEGLVPEKKKKKKRVKEKKKRSEENDESVKKKKKRKKDKGKKEAKEKKKHKKSKEKKKEEEKDEKSPQKMTKEQVVAELKEVEEKIAKKKEEKTEKKEKLDKGRKRRHSEREEDSKRHKHDKLKKNEDEKHKRDENKEEENHEKHRRVSDDSHEKHRRTSDENKVDKVEDHDKHRRSDEIKIEVKEEHPLKKKLEKAKKHELERKIYESRKNEEVKKEEKKKSEERRNRKRKSRWSEAESVSGLPDFEGLKVIEEIQKNEPVINYEKKKIEDFEKIIEEIKQSTPDTDEYHSHWESDDEISSSVPRHSLKMNRSWESDEELFERSHNRSQKPSEFGDLEIPLNLNLQNFSRRSREEKPFSVSEELKLLEEERKSLSEERRKLELEKEKIKKMQEEAKLEMLEEKKVPVGFEESKGTRMRSSTPEEIVKVKKEKPDVDFNLDTLNNSLLSNVSSSESNFPIAALETEYEEFIKAVSSESSVASKKKERRSSSSSSDSDHKKKKRKMKTKKKKKKRKNRDCEGLLLGKSIFNEFDIPVPSDLPEMVPTPVPVPSPILPLDKLLPLTTPPLLLNSLAEEELKPEGGLDLTKPFVFSSIVLPSKKAALVDNSNLKLDDDSDSDFTDKLAKKEEGEEEKDEGNKTEIEEKVEEKKEEEEKVEEQTSVVEEAEPQPEPVKPIDIQDVPLPPEEAPPPVESKIRRSRSLSPPRKTDKSRERRRSRSRSRERIRRREPSPRRRHSSPRRRSPLRRRSPRRRSPSPRRRSPRRRRRSPSLSPPRRGGARKRTPSPRRRSSPLNSPLDGFKRSVADSTISDDMLPQPTPDDYSESPPYVGGAKKGRRSSLSPQASPKRIPLDDRINQVLGLEKSEMAPPKQDPYPNYYGYAPQYQYQYPEPPKNAYPSYAPPQVMYTQPPPPIAKPVATPTKVVQVGNILQVVPTEEMPPPVLENKVSERSQKIVQVGNMLQIVPAVIASPKPQLPEPQPVAKPVPSPEKQSAEAVMKQKIAERRAEREKRRLERERRRKEKERKRKEKEKRKQLKQKQKTENMIKRAIQLEAEALANDVTEEGVENPETPVPLIISTPPTCKSILLHGGSKQRKSVQFADGVRPGEGTSPSGGEELSSPPPQPRKLPKEKRYKKIKVPKKSKKKKIRVKVVKKAPVVEEDDEDDDDDNLPPPSPPPGSPPPHIFPSRVKTHTINNVHQYVGNIIQQSPAAGFPYRAPMPVVMNRHQPPPAFMQPTYPSDVNSLSHPTYQGVSSHH